MKTHACTTPWRGSSPTHPPTHTPKTHAKLAKKTLEKIFRPGQKPEQTDPQRSPRAGGGGHSSNPLSKPTHPSPGGRGDVDTTRTSARTPPLPGATPARLRTRRSAGGGRWGRRSRGACRPPGTATTSPPGSFERPLGEGPPTHSALNPPPLRRICPRNIGPSIFMEIFFRWTTPAGGEGPSKKWVNFEFIYEKSSDTWSPLRPRVGPPGRTHPFEKILVPTLGSGSSGRLQAQGAGGRPKLEAGRLIVYE